MTSRIAATLAATFLFTTPFLGMAHASDAAPAQVDDALIQEMREIASHSTVLISIKA